MKDFSQNGEQEYILSHFGTLKGRFLDIGANDGVTLSNTCALALRGWEGVYIEPSPEALKRLHANLQSTFPAAGERLKVIDKALSTESGTVTLWENGEHLKKGDVALLSTIKESETIRWKKTDTFYPVQVEAVTFAELELDGTFEFISIDAEGLDLSIMKQIDFTRYGTEMLIIEYNNDSSVKAEMVKIAAAHKMNLIHSNFENLIFAL